MIAGTFLGALKRRAAAPRPWLARRSLMRSAGFASRQLCWCGVVIIVLLTGA
jgi:hypothetical protein